MLTLGAALACPANAGDALFAPKTNGAPHAASCSGLGPGYFAVRGSTACVKITGYVAADANFGPARSYQRPFAPNAQLEATPLAGGTADVRFATPNGPLEMHFSAGRQPSAR